MLGADSLRQPPRLLYGFCMDIEGLVITVRDLQPQNRRLLCPIQNPSARPGFGNMAVESAPEFTAALGDINCARRPRHCYRKGPGCPMIENWHRRSKASGV